MRTEIITRRDGLMIRRLVLEPAEAMPWHTDPCHRFTVVVRGDQLRIEFRDSGAEQIVAVTAGMAEWDEPEPRVHRGVNAGTQTYEEVVLFFLQRPDADPQPEARSSGS
jgi:quercetin dioxygenase-like cupin family protein